jgi:hypothetical protein
MDLAALIEPIGVFVGFILTLLVLSYIIGDNVLFRFTVHLFIGVASGYAAMMVFYNVIWNQLFVPLISDPGANFALTIPPLLLGLWLLTKVSSRIARFGNPVMAYLVGVGAATAIGGAVIGTVFPQVQASASLFDMGTAQNDGSSLVSWFFKGVIILTGTIATIGFFHFSTRSNEDHTEPQRFPFIDRIVAPIGTFFIATTFGALFVGVFSAALAALIERVYFLWNFILQFLP